MTFGSGTANASAWAAAILRQMPPGTQMTISFDTSSLNKLFKKAGELKRNKNRVITAAMRAGMRVTSAVIKQDIPAYTTKAVARMRISNPLAGIRGKSKMKEAKRAIGVLARISKGGRGPVPKGEPEAKVGSNVGMRKRTSADRPRTGRKGIGRGNLHWYLAGTKPRITTTGVYTGQMRKTMVVQKAWGATKSRVLEKMRRNLQAGIKREAAKP